MLLIILQIVLHVFPFFALIYLYLSEKENKLLKEENKKIIKLQHDKREISKNNMLLRQIIYDKREEIQNLEEKIQNLEEELHVEKLRNTLGRL